MLEFEPLCRALGVVVSGIDLREPIPAAVAAELTEALVRHQVLFFRDQPIEPAHHMALARCFGEPVGHPAYPTVDGYPQINILENTPEVPPKIDTWHTDMTFLQEPPLGSILRARVVPEIGGDTLWASTAAAYDGLSERMQRHLDGLTAVHSFAHGFRHSLAEPGGRERLASAVEKNPPVVHPVVRRHPVSGRKAIFVNRLFTTHIRDLPERESDALLTFLYDHIETPEYTVRFRWQVDSIAFWDNRATIHRPVNDFWPAHRKMERITIAGDRPLG
ncbi:MAG: taurine dioxygenase [Myxococcales bacterium]|nr:taurine dioxygenase [Myxococcales bacterium]